MIDLMENHLKEACQLTGAAWAAVADCDKGKWFVEAAYHLPKQKHAALESYLSLDAAEAWVDAAWHGKNAPQVGMPEDGKLGTGSLYVFGVQSTSEIVLVCADELDAKSRRIWRLFANLMDRGAPEDASETYTPAMQAEVAYDLPRAAERVLSSFLRVVEPQGAWLAIHRGDSLEIVAQRNDPKLMGIALPVEPNRLLRRMQRNLGDVAVLSDSAEWESLPHAVRRSTRCWLCLPLVIGKRVIGAVALWGSEQFPPQQVKVLRGLAARVAQPIELIVTFNELTGHLRRLAMLNDFALAVSSGQNLDQIARRVFGYLARSFHTELIAMYLPSTDGRLIREYRNREGKFSAQTAAHGGHPILPYMRGRIFRMTDTSGDFQPTYPAARSALMVPLKYRSQTIGLLSLEGVRPDAFSEYDEHLMVVIASHLAGLIEYGRLREEAEGRARNLGLIHEVVERVIGLNDKQQVAEISADLLGQFFAYELAGVMFSEDSGESVFGFGGSRQDAYRTVFADQDFISGDAIATRVFRTGQNVLANAGDEGSQERSELCVALKDGERVIGLIDVQSSQPNAFTNNDLLAMESLAGVLASVVSSARHYERLQETIQQLRAAQIEVQARLKAQQEAESRLVQAAKLVAVGEMAAGIAHELNNPLTTVTGFAELILDETPKESEHRADLEMIQHEALRARGVVRRLLDFARQGERTRAKCDLNEIIEDVLALTKHFMHTSGVQLDVELAKELPWVSVDSNQMKQVFLNLVHNAVQAMPTGGKLNIKTELQFREGRSWATAAIHDTGLGISPKDIDRIFEPFYTTRGSHGGTGLGLSVSYGIVTDHGGTIDVQSQPSEGTTFTVWLPY